MNTVQLKRKPPAQRNFVAKHAQRSGAGRHTSKHKRSLLARADRIDRFYFDGWRNL